MYISRRVPVALQISTYLSYMEKIPIRGSINMVDICSFRSKFRYLRIEKSVEDEFSVL